MKTERQMHRPALCSAMLVTFTSVAITSGSAQAEILYSTMDMMTNGTANNHNAAYIGGFGAFGEFRDVQVADDFNLGTGHYITSVTAPFFLQAPLGGGPPAGGILVEFFENLPINRPAETPIAAAFAATFIAIPLDYNGNLGYTFTIDLTSGGASQGLELGSGTWWVSIIPVDETPSGGHWRQWGQGGLTIGNPANRRAGGIDHGNGYPGVHYSNNDWGPFTTAQGGLRQLAMMIEGSPVPGPAGLVVFSLGCLVFSRRSRNS